VANKRGYDDRPFHGSRIEVTHSRELFHLGGFFHCHRVGFADCQFPMETGCSGTQSKRTPLNAAGDKIFKRPTAQELTGMSDEELQAATPDQCRCVCDKHPCCSKKNFVLANANLLGNTFRHVERREDCCSLCTNHPKCGAWEWSDRKVCVLKDGSPTFMLNQNSAVVTYAGPRSGMPCAGQPVLPKLSTATPLVSYGYYPDKTHAHEMPLGLCHGDCDRDSHCAPGLRCFQQHHKDHIPGCQGEVKEGMDYCVLDGHQDLRLSAP
jgi:hypothetical protein